MALREAANEPPLTAAFGSSAADGSGAGGSSIRDVEMHDPIVVDVDALGMADFASPQGVQQHLERQRAMQQQRAAFYPNTAMSNSPFRFLPTAAVQQPQLHQQVFPSFQQQQQQPLGFDPRTRMFANQQPLPATAAAAPFGGGGAAGMDMATIRQAVAGMGGSVAEEEQLAINVARVLQNMRRHEQNPPRPTSYYKSEQQAQQRFLASQPQSFADGDAYFPTHDSPVPLSHRTAQAVASQLRASDANSSLQWPQFALHQRGSVPQQQQQQQQWYAGGSEAPAAVTGVTHYFSPPASSAAYFSDPHQQQLAHSMAAATSAAWARNAPTLSPMQRQPTGASPVSHTEWLQRLDQHAQTLQFGAAGAAGRGMMDAPAQWAPPPPPERVVFDSSAPWRSSWQ
jgi:hypothetical protein